MNKGELVEQIYQSLHRTLPRYKISRIINCAIATISDEVTSGGSVTVAGFGKFFSRRRAGRLWRNPKTDELHQIESYILPRFQAASRFKEAVSRGKNQNN